MEVRGPNLVLFKVPEKCRVHTKVRSSYCLLAYFSDIFISGTNDNINARNENIGKICKRTITWTDFSQFKILISGWASKIKYNFNHWSKTHLNFFHIKKLSNKVPRIVNFWFSRVFFNVENEILFAHYFLLRLGELLIQL